MRARHWIAALVIAGLWTFGFPAIFRGFAAGSSTLLAYGTFLAVGSLLAVFGALLLLRETPAERGFCLPKRTDWRDLWLLLAVLFPVFLLGRLLDPGFDQWFIERAIGGQPLVQFFLVTSVFVVHEELLLRFLQDRLTALLPLPVALLGLSVFFGLLHYVPAFPRHGIGLAVSAFIASFALAVLYDRSRSLLATTVLHLAINAVSLVGILSHVSGRGERVFWIVFAALFALAVRPAWTRLRGTLGKPPLRRLRLFDVLLLLLLAVGIPILAFRA